MPTTATIAPIERSIPRTRMGNVCPMARMATNENPDMRFSILVAEANPGALTQKKALVAAKNSRRVTVAGRSIMESAHLSKDGPQRKALRHVVPRENYQR